MRMDISFMLKNYNNGVFYESSEYKDVFNHIKLAFSEYSPRELYEFINNISSELPEGEFDKFMENTFDKMANDMGEKFQSVYDKLSVLSSYDAHYLEVPTCSFNELRKLSL